MDTSTSPIDPTLFLDRILDRIDPYLPHTDPPVEHTQQLYGLWLALRRFQKGLSDADIETHTGITSPVLSLLETGLAEESLISDDEISRFCELLTDKQEYACQYDSDLIASIIFGALGLHTVGDELVRWIVEDLDRNFITPNDLSGLYTSPDRHGSLEAASAGSYDEGNEDNHFDMVRTPHGNSKTDATEKPTVLLGACLYPSRNRTVAHSRRSQRRPQRAALRSSMLKRLPPKSNREVPRSRVKVRRTSYSHGQGIQGKQMVKQVRMVAVLRRHIGGNPMNRTRLLGGLLLLAFSLIVLHFAATPLPTVRQTPPVAHLVQTHDDIRPASVAVHAVGLNLPVDMDVLDQRAEVVFDN